MPLMYFIKKEKRGHATPAFLSVCPCQQALGYMIHTHVKNWSSWLQIKPFWADLQADELLGYPRVDPGKKTQFF